MNLYYADGDRKVGPIGKDELRQLVKEGQVNAKTLVWQSGMDRWEELGTFLRRRARGGAPGKSALPAATPGPQAVCAECGRSFAEGDMVRYQNLHVCAACKPIFFQKIKEGVSVGGALAYAGFWIRFGALFIDGIILAAANAIVYIPLSIMTAATEKQPVVAVAMMPVMILLQYAIPAFYDTWFVGKYAATPGKMACKIKIVMPDGNRVSYPRALGRHFAKWISGMILAIGYIMAGFDDQKRALHDRICETRVVQSQA